MIDPDVFFSRKTKAALGINLINRIIDFHFSEDFESDHLWGK